MHLFITAMVTTLAFNAYLHKSAWYRLQGFQMYPEAEENERYMERDCREHSTITTRLFYFCLFKKNTKHRSYLKGAPLIYTGARKTREGRANPPAVEI